MTPAERTLYAAMERQAAASRPELRAALLDLWAYVRTALTPGQIERAVRAGSVETLVRTVVDAFAVERATVPVREAIRAAYRRSAVAGIRTLPLPKSATVDLAFNWLNPRIIEAVQVLESTALASLRTEAAETVRQVVRRGIEQGVGPRALIPQLRNSIGLSASQDAAVDAYRLMLEGGPRVAVSKDALNSALRDRRFDEMVKRARKNGERLSPEQIDRMTDAYRRKMQAWNAETHARTTALDATRAGQRASWETAIQQGGIDRGRVRKRWIATLDARVRPEHADMNGVEVQIDERFGVDGGVMLPGEGTYNCRCAVAYRLAPRR